MKHCFGYLKIRDYAVAHRPDGNDVAGRAAEHPFCLFTYGKHMGSAAFNGNY